MNLEQFITETLKQILSGVKNAQKATDHTGGKINPRHQKIRMSTAGKIPSDDDRLRNVDFDVAVTATEGSGKQGGAGLVVGPFALGGRGSTETTNSSVSRIKFTVPIVLPTQEDSTQG